ncbi:transcriptional regulator [Candidatus Saccharibacteria bacterium CG10_big_fil_rev_8_21_14_0_10_47_8]|nr:MAG: transcriptional regulator [Candidatus Saccharibacteria bacterium CG10_big_fil_rev_8_21_14_0_10_47_8]
MIEQLFGSKTRVKLLQLFYANPNRSFYVREITRKIDEQINSVRRELSNLLSIGIISSEANNNRLYYEVSQDYEYYQPLAMIFGGAVSNSGAAAAKKPASTSKSTTKPKAAADVAPEHPLAKAVRGTGRVDLAILTGQFTRDEGAGVDVLLVGDLNQAKVARFISELEKAENKELRYVVMALKDLNYRVQINDRFISNVLDAKKQVIINSQPLPINQ